MEECTLVAVAAGAGILSPPRCARWCRKVEIGRRMFGQVVEPEKCRLLLEIVLECNLEQRKHSIKTLFVYQ